jgi:hypoxanthine phosphoribosyltransferase
MVIFIKRVLVVSFDISAFKNILVVDDSIASGSAMIEVKESLEHLSDQFNIKYCAIYVIQVKRMVDYYFETVPLPRYFQWNILNHTTLEKRVLISMCALCRSFA